MRKSSNSIPPGGAAPEFGRIAVAVATFGVSRSWLYRAAPEHPGLLVKLGSATLVNYRVLRDLLATLPVATVRAESKPADRKATIAAGQVAT